MLLRMLLLMLVAYAIAIAITSAPSPLKYLHIVTRYLLLDLFCRCRDMTYVTMTDHLTRLPSHIHLPSTAACPENVIVA